MTDDQKRLAYWLAFKNRPAGVRWREKMKKGKKRLEGARAREGWGE